MQVAELLDNEQFELERLRQRSPRGKLLTSKTIPTENHARRGKFTNTLQVVGSAVSWMKKEEKKCNARDYGKKSQEGVSNVTESTTACDIWITPRKIKNKGSKITESHESSKETSASKINSRKFRIAAKTTVLLEQFKQGHAICTCENLDARCKVHDT
jgi:hypothetical protein